MRFFVYHKTFKIVKKIGQNVLKSLKNGVKTVALIMQLC